MTKQKAAYYHKALTTLRNVIDGLLDGLQQEMNQPDAPVRKRRNLKDARIEKFELRYATGLGSKNKKSQLGES